MSYTLSTLPYTALQCVIITINNLQEPVKFTVHVLVASCHAVFTVKSTGSFYSVQPSRGTLHERFFFFFCFFFFFFFFFLVALCLFFSLSPHAFKGTHTVSGEVTLLKLFFAPYWKGVSLKGKNLLPACLYLFVNGASSLLHMILLWYGVEKKKAKIG